jgi:uncharacterized membrane protein YeaQ/YmgE (transglycosylase-associated protein family)
MKHTSITKPLSGSIIGIVAGFLASLVMGGGGLLRYLITGVLGAFVGGFLAQQVQHQPGIWQRLVEQIIVATVGAIIVVLAASADQPDEFSRQTRVAAFSAVA